MYGSETLVCNINSAFDIDNYWFAYKLQYLGKLFYICRKQIMYDNCDNLQGTVTCW